MELGRFLLKILTWLLLIGFVSNMFMQKIAYSFYKGNKHFEDIQYIPTYIQLNENLSGYGYNLTSNENKIMLFFGGSNYVAYNSIGIYAGHYNCTFVSADFYGTQNSKGKMNLKSMQQTAIDLYDWVKSNYPDKKIIIMGHSYGTGIATYLASKKSCDCLILLSAYTELADLYNKIIPIFRGPAKIFISDNICLKKYAGNVTCPAYVIGSNDDKTLNVNLQKKVQQSFKNGTLTIFNNITHEDYLINVQVINYIKRIVRLQAAAAERD